MQEHIYYALQEVQKHCKEITTLTPSLYNDHRKREAPRSHTLMKKLGKTWNEILQDADLPPVSSRKTLAYLSNALHLLEKRIIDRLHLSWSEKNIPAPTKSRQKILRPDSLCMDSFYSANAPLLILDVKLSITSSPQAVYKYLSLFEEGIQDTTLAQQTTFFNEWDSRTVNVEAEQFIYQDGQMGLFYENNILFICYLIGWKKDTLLPGREVSLLRDTKSIKSKNKRKLPHNMEVRFVEFKNLPKLYTDIAGQEYTDELNEMVRPIMEISEIIKKAVLNSVDIEDGYAKGIYGIVRDYEVEDALGMLQSI